MFEQRDLLHELLRQGNAVASKPTHSRKAAWDAWRKRLNKVVEQHSEFKDLASVLELRYDGFVDDLRRLGRWLPVDGPEDEPTTRTHQRRPSNQKRDRRMVFVVHGRDGPLRDDMFDFLQALDLRPIEWSQAIRMTGDAAPFIGDILAEAFRRAQAVVVVLSPDEEARLRPALCQDTGSKADETVERQPRPNVLFEAGMALGCRPKRTILVEFGQMRSFSDVAGRHSIRPGEGPDWRRDLVNRLKAAGCKVDDSGTRYLSIGEFEPTTG